MKKEFLTLILRKDNEIKEFFMTLKLGVWSNIKLMKKLIDFNKSGWQLVDVEGTGESANFIRSELKLFNVNPDHSPSISKTMKYSAQVIGVPLDKLEEAYQSIIKKAKLFSRIKYTTIG